MKRQRIKLVYRKCPRCGKTIAGVNRSITGADSVFKKYAGICEDCITPDELKEIEQAQAKAIRGL